MKLIERKMYISWEKDLEYFLRHHRLGSRWKKLRGYYHSDFAVHVDRLIEKLEG